MRNTIKTRVVLNGPILCLQVKPLDHGDVKYDWVIHKEWFPPQKTSSGKAEILKTRAGFTTPPIKSIQDKDGAYVMFSDLTNPPSGKHLVDFLVQDYLEPRHSHNIQDTVDHTNKKMVIVKVLPKEACTEWMDVYSKKEFNGKLPTVQIIT